ALSVTAYQSDRYRWIYDLNAWAVPAISLVGIVAFGVAAGRAGGTAITAIAGFVLYPVPPVAPFIYGHLPFGDTSLTVMYGALMIVRALGVAVLGATIGRAALAPRRDHRRAARGFRWLIAGVIAHAIAVVLVALFAMSDDETFATS